MPSSRHDAARRAAVDLGAAGIVHGGDVPFYCTVCRLSLSGEAQVRERRAAWLASAPVPALPAS